MEKWNKYHSVTDNKPPQKNVVNFVEKYKITGNAIDLGCGSGSDTVYLIKNGWNVLAIDRTDVEKLISNKLNDEWNTPEDNRTFFSRAEAIDLFKDFEIIEFNEIENDNPTALGKIKHWHTFEFIARKK